MQTVVIAAHNEEAVLAACIDALLRQGVSERDIVVVANGCTDSTASVATKLGVTVIDLPQPGKAGALNAGDAVALHYPRIYLDADIVVPPGGLESLIRRFEATPSPLAVVPRRRLNTTGRPWPVRAYFAINERLPAFRGGLFGRGMIALSETGRARFDAFPTMVADDLFLDSQFTAGEKAETSDVEIFVDAPFTTRDLLRRLVRVRRGNAEMRAAVAAGRLDIEVRPADRWAWLRHVVLPEPRLAFAAVPYVALTTLAALLARRAAKPGGDWERDESTRARQPPSPRVASE